MRNVPENAEFFGTPQVDLMEMNGLRAVSTFCESRGFPSARE
jgi:hypothetical protein